MDRTILINIYALIIIAILILKGSTLGHNLRGWLRRAYYAINPFSQKAEKPGEKPFSERKQIVEDTLKGLNCESEPFEADDRARFTFDYQSGHFLLDVPHVADIPLQLAFPGILTVTLDEIDLVRFVCNEVNAKYPWGVRAVYTVNSEENEISVHLMANITEYVDKDSLTTQMKKLMTSCFAIQHFFLESHTTHRKENIRYEQPDIEFARSRAEALEQLLMEAEQETDSLGDLILGDEAELSVRNLLEALGSGPVFMANTLTITAGEYHLKSDDKYAIMDYELDTPLRTKEAGQPAGPDFVNNDAIIRLTVIPYGPEAFATHESQTHDDDAVPNDSDKRPDERPFRELTFVLYLHAERKMGNSLYFRLTWVIPDTVAGMGRSRCFIDSQSATASGSVLLCRDLDDDCKAKHQEVSYMLVDAADKQREGHLSELTPEQKLILGLSDHYTAYNLYWGDRLYRQRCYYEAAIRLERAWHVLVDNNPLALQDKSDRIYEVAYLLGMCFFKQDLYKAAYYYLNVATGRNDAKSHEALIDCMMAMDDPRAITTIRSALHNLKEQSDLAIKSGGDVPEVITDHLHFLRRQEIRIYIHLRYLEEAEKLSKQLLHDEDDKDFALSALAKIQRLRGRGIKERTPHFDEGGEADSLN